MKIKVCGITDKDDLRSIAASGADLAGFIFVDSSPRYAAGKIDPTLNAKLSTEFPSLKKVGVFLNEKPEVILQAIDLYKLDAVQLHGEESVEECKALSGKTELIKTIAVADERSFGKCRSYEGAVNYFLFDTSGPLAGGNGFAFDWNLLEKYQGQTPFYLSGGIGPSDTVRISRLPARNSKLIGVDVNSKFELYPGKKNLVLVDSFINNIKNGIHAVRSL